MQPNFLHIVGARPNFVKAAPVIHALHGVQTLVHTGQHYDDCLSGQLFRQLGISPDYSLQKTKVPEMVKDLVSLIETLHPDNVVVYGDVNSTLAGALAAHETKTHLIHVEAGLRSNDWSMPEEQNRYVVDHLSDLLFTSCFDGSSNLYSEGIHPSKISLVGNVMIDSLIRFLPPIGYTNTRYGLVTLHRQSNVDDPHHLEQIIEQLGMLPIQLLFPKHPRTKVGSLRLPKNIILLGPQGYKEFLDLEQNAQFVITDSGGVQEETTYLGVPCLTLRPNTERPVTIAYGTNWLVNLATLREKVDTILSGNWRKGTSITFWDGHAANRIAEVLQHHA